MEKMLSSQINELINILGTKKTESLKVVIGLDGFVDEILHVVATRKNAHEYNRLRSMKEYGQKIVNASGLSTNFELVKIDEKLGGNGPILSNALATAGVDLTCIGSLGFPQISNVFQPMTEICNLISIANPGHTDAIEFDDGKLIIGKHDSIKDITWENIKKTIGIPKLIQLFSEAKLVGLENWSMLPFMSDIWRGLLSEIFPSLPPQSNNRFVFFDLADPDKRTSKDITEALNLIKTFSSYFKVILGLNLKEAIEIANVLGYKEYDSSNPKVVNLETLVKVLSSNMQIYSIVVHPTCDAATVMGESYYHVSGPYTPKPKLTTGAGDNFNAGFCLGQILDLTPSDSLLMGVATSGYYVRNCKSPTFSNLIKFLEMWSKDNV